MDNELRKTLDVKLNINIDGTAAFGIVLASITGLCFCFYRGCSPGTPMRNARK